MNEMYSNNREDYNERTHTYRYDDRDYNDRENYRGNYREDYRENYRYDYRDYRGYDDRDYNYRKRDYDRRGGKINYRNYRNQDYHEELDTVVFDMKEQTRKLEDIAEMAENPQDKNMLTKIAQKEKENYMYLKQLSEK